MRGIFFYGLMTTRGDWQRKLRDLRRFAGVDTVWFMLNFLDGKNEHPNPMSPFLPAGYWKPWEAVGASGPDYAIPIPNLATRNPAFTARLREILVELKANEQSPVFIMADCCSEGGDGSWQQFLDVWYSNTDAYPDWEHPERIVVVNQDGSRSLRRALAGGNQALELNKYHEALELEVWAMCIELGIERAYAIPKNEYGYRFGLAYTLEMGLEWLRLRCEHLARLGFIVISSWGWDVTARMVEPFVGRLDQHWMITPADLEAAEALAWPAKIIVNTDGKSGAGGPVSAFGGRTISVDQARALGEDMTRRGIMDWCITPQEMIDSQTEPTNADAIQTAPFEALARATGWRPTVKVKVCAFSNRVANAWCPVVVETEFMAGMEPTEVCATHYETVSVELCAETRLLAVEWCPKKVSETFKRGEEPTAACSKHKKPCSYFWNRRNYLGWFRCVFFGKH